MWKAVTNFAQRERYKERKPNGELRNDILSFAISDAKYAEVDISGYSNAISAYTSYKRAIDELPEAPVRVVRRGERLYLAMTREVV